MLNILKKLKAVFIKKLNDYSAIVANFANFLYFIKLNT